MTLIIFGQAFYINFADERSSISFIARQTANQNTFRCCPTGPSLFSATDPLSLIMVTCTSGKVHQMSLLSIHVFEY
jgi:dipeptide/tripeptide permease